MTQFYGGLHSLVQGALLVFSWRDLRVVTEIENNSQSVRFKIGSDVSKAL